MIPRLELFLHVEPDAHAWLDAELCASYEQALSALLLELLVQPKGPDHVLSTLDMIELSIVDDEQIACVHAEFLDDPTATDVITFHHGEILVSCDTAARYAAEYGLDPREELFRYLVHGLVHLHGYLDALPEQREGLFAVQEPLVAQFYPCSC